ncbi:MAG TPA: ricin-type beta-trefoil lectin domain protein [Candidatus Saccharimonadales bacterium]|nr:ricin-type beta-trefoil lectin domain protein [Candidatus Saccharimonadales bacterium]
MQRNYGHRPVGRKSTKSTRSTNVNKKPIFIFGLILIAFFIFNISLSRNHVSAESSRIKSGVPGYCLDLHDNTDSSGTIVDNWGCNNSSAQDWVARDITVTHDNKYCLMVQANGRTPGTKVEMNLCDGSPGQVWLRDQTGFYNPNSGMCLSSSATKPTAQLYIDNCSALSTPQGVWTTTTSLNKGEVSTSVCDGSGGAKVACNAVKEWTAWQSTGADHEALLTTYTDGAPYEEWCADFVSYVYKESGYPFTQGEADGWDESNANNVQNMGFTMHSASSDYIPKPGDVAYFDYNGGHVEIVVSGGKNPTFVYGDSATIDPSTGNGQMMANTIAHDNTGQVIYYLSYNY